MEAKEEKPLRVLIFFAVVLVAYFYVKAFNQANEPVLATQTSKLVEENEWLDQQIKEDELEAAVLFFELKGNTKEWVDWINEQVSVPMTDYQREVAVLTAMKMGKNAFLNSDFLTWLKKQDYMNAGYCLYLQDDVGNLVEDKDAEKFFQVLYWIWNGQLSCSEIMFCPIGAYKKLDTEHDYALNDFWEILDETKGRTPSEIIGMG